VVDNRFMTEQKSVTEAINEYREQTTRLLDGEVYPPTLEQAMDQIQSPWSIVIDYNTWINDNKRRIIAFEERVNALEA
jgi:hypothetical protein